MLRALGRGAVLSAIAIATTSHPAISQLQPTQYGFPVKSPELETGDLPCYMTTSNARTLDLGRLCGATTQTATSRFQRSVRRTRLAFSQYSSQYERLAETYPDENVRRMLSATRSDPESVCRRLDQGQTVEQIRSEDIAQLRPSGNSTRDNARKQNIEITLKLAPQYYCPENAGTEIGNSNFNDDFENNNRRSNDQPFNNNPSTLPSLEPSNLTPRRNLEPSNLAPSRNLEPSRLTPNRNISITNQ